MFPVGRRLYNVDRVRMAVERSEHSVGRRRHGGSSTGSRVAGRVSERESHKQPD